MIVQSTPDLASTPPLTLTGTRRFGVFVGGLSITEQAMRRRRGSPANGHHAAAELRGGNGDQNFVGFGRASVTLEPDTETTDKLAMPVTRRPMAVPARVARRSRSISAVAGSRIGVLVQGCGTTGTGHSELRVWFNAVMGADAIDETSSVKGAGSFRSLVAYWAS